MALAILVLPGLVGSASAASYAWTVTCKVEYGSATASWDWFQDGAVITGTGGTGQCFQSGAGDRPANANGITATLQACALTSTGSGMKCGTTSATQSFDPTGSFTLTLKKSASGSFKICGWGGGCNNYHSSIHAQFTISG